MGFKIPGVQSLSDVPHEELVALLGGLEVHMTADFLKFVPVDIVWVPDRELNGFLRSQGCHNLYGAWVYYQDKQSGSRTSRKPEMHQRIGQLLAGFGLPVDESAGS